VAVIIVPPLRALGIDPWVAHFFAFLLAIWGELSPPTSLTAAVASRIADASFMRTMFEALKICLPITFMSFAIFIRSDMVVDPGWNQILETLLVAAGVLAITFATFGRFVEANVADVPARALLALLGFVVMFHPDFVQAAAFAVPAAALVALGIYRYRHLAAVRQPAAVGVAGQS
jgi:TRAP-type uncharacterized transport system fused permease subunit